MTSRSRSVVDRHGPINIRKNQCRYRRVRVDHATQSIQAKAPPLGIEGTSWAAVFQRASCKKPGVQDDALSMMQQLGAVPAPAGAESLPGGSPFPSANGRRTGGYQ
jgi:hypothetical protein